MTLSDKERHVLDQIERDFATADPALAHILSAPARRGARDFLLVGAGLPVGLGLILLGLLLPQLFGTALAVIGYLVVVTSSYSTTIAVRLRRSTCSAGPG